MKVSELKPKVGGINLEFDVIDKGPVREFNKFGKAGRVCNATVRDESGQVKLSLWNDDCDKVNAGDRVKLTDGWTGEYQGEIQLSTGRAGKLEVIGKAEESAAPNPARSAAAKPAPVMRNFSVEPDKSKFKKPGSDSFGGDDEDDEGGEGGDFDDDEFEEVDEEFVE